MKNILKMTDEQIDQNFLNLIKEKQLVALADYYADKISDDNKPLDFKSPLRLSGEENKDENEESQETEDQSTSGTDQDEEAPETPPADNSGEEQQDKNEPSFGLG